MNGTWNRKVSSLGLFGCLAVGMVFTLTAWGQNIDPFADEFKARSRATLTPAGADPFSKENQARPAVVEPKPPVAEPAKQPSRSSQVLKVISFQVAVEPPEARPGQVVKLIIAGTPKEEYHTYSFTKKTKKQFGKFVSVLSIKETPAFKALWPVIESEPVATQEETGDVFLEHEKTFTLKQDILIDPKAPTGLLAIPLSIDLQVCDKNQCIPGVIERTAEVQVKGTPVALTPDIEKRLLEKPPEVEVVSPVPTVFRGSAGSGLLAFLLTGVFWGAVSLITPCVFPMIPITVSFFLKQSEKEHHRPITMAFVYCATIVVVLTIAAVALLSVFRALSVNPIMNFVIGGLFIFFSLSLFGMYDIELPSGLARFTSAREGKGGLLGTMFMALTFTIISFACVAPFLGGFGGTASNSNLTLTHRIFGGLAFAVTFASPFFILALFPTLLKKMPKSGAWLNTVKVVMGFLELAAAFKFLRTGELVVLAQPSIFTYDLVLGLYVALSLLCGLYLLGVYRLPHDSPVDNLSVPRMLFSLAFLCLAFYLAPALFKGDKGQNQRPGGDVFAWLDSFLLPEDTESDLPWTGDFQKGLAQAQASRKLVFVDFTGKSCTNCKLNERSVFSQPDFKSMLEKYELVQLYTDVVPNRFYPLMERVKFGSSTSRQHADALRNLELEREKFGTESLPLYVILEPLPNGKYREVGRQEGRITDQAEFMKFLYTPLEKNSSLGSFTGLNWNKNFTKGLAEARSNRKLVFVDFAARSNTNSKLNQTNIFPVPAVRDLLKKYELVQLYVDIVPAELYPEPVRNSLDEEKMHQLSIADGQKNLDLERQRFDTEASPLYVILQPLDGGDFKEIARLEGRIANAAGFVTFLQEPLKEQAKVASR